MTDISVTVEISPTSKESIFAGNLLKAPPLNRRGRKKWHERYIVLKANRTLECFKSKKAALSHKSPRRVIDLRSCINLEIGLEYKNLNHILSIGTFKRTFFFAAPSDPLMLQWSYLLEKTKNAQDGELIEVLDIGLRKSRDKPAVHRVKQAPPTQRFSVGSPQKNRYGTGSKVGITLAHFSRDSTETINLRASRESGHELTESGRSFGNSGDQSDGSTIERTSSCSEYSTTSSISGQSPSHVTRPTSHVTIIPNRVPPPSGFLAAATRNKDGYFVAGTTGSLPRSQPKSAESAIKKGSKGKKGKREQKVEFVEKPGSLHRGRAMKGGSPLRTKTNEDLASAYSSGQYSTPSPSLTSVTPSDQSAALHLHSNMKRSFRYRKITLRPEKPLFKEEENHSDSEDEEDRSHSSSGEEGNTKLPNVEICEVHVQKKGTSFSKSPVSMEMTFDPSTNNERQTLNVIPKARANGYSKMTIGGMKCQTQLNTGTKLDKIVSKVNKRPRANSQPAIQVDHVTSHLDHMISLSQEDQSDLFLDEASLPARPPSDGIIYASRNSLDDILVAPPDMFNPSDTEFKASSPSKLKRINTAEEIVGHVTKGSNHVTARIIPSSHSPPSEVKSHDSQVIHDRNSTESNDTGYTSGASPALNDTQERAHVDIGEFQLEFKESCQSSSSSSTISDDVQQRDSSNPHNLASNQSLDVPRSYIPLVFHSTSYSTTSFTVQVCLVETSDELIKDLISLKSLEKFNLVDCDEIHGDDNVEAVSDDFTVETALEDLEFGFSVDKSTQKDLFMRKVRESTFEIKNLFGTNKPFSCDVVIRHADQMIVLPIEI